MSGTSILSYIMLSACIVYAFANPAYQEIKLLRGEKGKYDDSLALVADIENKKNALLEQYNSISEEDKKKISTVLPDSLNFVKLVADIANVASVNGVIVDNITLREMDSSVGESVSDAGAPKPYRSAIIGFSFDASFSQFNAFIDNLEKSLRILDVRSVKLQTNEGGRDTYQVEFETYWVK